MNMLSQQASLDCSVGSSESKGRVISDGLCCRDFSCAFMPTKQIYFCLRRRICITAAGKCFGGV